MASNDSAIWESRSHIAGTCFDHDSDSVLLHNYGLHPLHTNDENVWNVLSRFTECTDTTHRGTDTGFGRQLLDEEIRDLTLTDHSLKQWKAPWAEMPAAITGLEVCPRDSPLNPRLRLRQ